MTTGYLETQISQWSTDEIRDRLGYIRAHTDNGGKCTQRNALEILNIAEQALKLADEAEQVVYDKKYRDEETAKDGF